MKKLILLLSLFVLPIFGMQMYRRISKLEGSNAVAYLEFNGYKMTRVGCLNGQYYGDVTRISPDGKAIYLLTSEGAREIFKRLQLEYESLVPPSKL